MKNLLKLGVLCAVTGCASIIDGSSQEMVINTSPAGADCVLNRDGMSIGRVNPTPGGVVVKKTKNNITIVCDKKGYEQTTFINKSGTQDATWGNIVAGGGIGWAIDSASGADNKYESPVNITLPKK